MTRPEPEFVTAADAARILGISALIFREQVERGQFRPSPWHQSLGLERYDRAAIVAAARGVAHDPMDGVML